MTSVRVVGPLYGLQSKNGYDMRPNTKLTTAQFRGFFTAWHYDPKPMIWDGLYVSIQPIPAKAVAVPSPAPTPAPTPTPSPSPSSSPSPRPTPIATPSASAAAMAVAAASQAPAQATAPDNNAAAVAEPATSILVATLAVLAVAALLAARYAGSLRRGRRGPDR